MISAATLSLRAGSIRICLKPSAFILLDLALVLDLEAIQRKIVIHPAKIKVYVHAYIKLIDRNVARVRAFSHI